MGGNKKQMTRDSRDVFAVGYLSVIIQFGGLGLGWRVIGIVFWLLVNSCVELQPNPSFTLTL